MPRRNAEVNKSWMHNETRLLYQNLNENRFDRRAVDRKGRQRPWPRACSPLPKPSRTAKKIALVASGRLTNEDNAAPWPWPISPG